MEDKDLQRVAIQERKKEIREAVSNVELKGYRERTVNPDIKLINKDDPQIKEDMMKIIIQYLQTKNLPATLLTLQDEINLKTQESQVRKQHIAKMKKAIREGEWTEVERLLAKDTFKNEKDFQYAVHKQIYLELLEKQEYQKAFTHLTKKLKPLETRQANPEEFRDLCYLLSCKSVQDAPYFRNWNGAKGKSREQLIEQFASIFDDLRLIRPRKADGLPNNRLIQLIQQALQYQIEFGQYQPKSAPRITTVLEDYSCFVVPNALKRSLNGHKMNVKCVEFVGEDGLSIVSGSSDNTLRIWSTEEGSCISVKQGHTSRIWDVSSNKTGNLIASASADATVKLWNVKGKEVECLQTFTGADGDVYTVDFHPNQYHLVSGGYDKVVRLYDTRNGALKKSFTGHTGPVTSAVFNAHGNLAITGSKDSTIKFWDVVSGVCIKTISLHLGEVTSVSANTSGSLLLSSSKDNSNRLWDLRTTNPIRIFKGHQNTSKNFVKSGFGPNEQLIVGGSEDGIVYVWDLSTGAILQKLASHSGIVYNALWNKQKSLLASCSQDCSLKLWYYDSAKSLFWDDSQ